MTTGSFQTRWPLNMHFTSYDNRLGEQALEESDLFLSHRLRLLCGVRLCDLSSSAGFRYEQFPDFIFDYLICKEDTVLLAIHLTDRPPWYGKFFHIAGLPVEEITGQRFSQGDVTKILIALNAILQNPSQSVWRCHLQPCPLELLESMFQAVLLETQRGGDIVPTEYGMHHGLVRVLQSGRHCAMATSETIQKLPELLSREIPSVPKRDKVPFDELLQAYRSGLSLDSQASANLVREVMEMPITTYMDGFPDELELLQDTLFWQCTTYADAVCGIYELLHSSDDEQYEQGVELMRILAMPPMEDKKIVDAVQMGRRVMGRMPDYMPKRYQKVRKAAQIKSFADCVSGIQEQPPAGMRLARATLASFFQGVGHLAQSGYPQWLWDTLKSYMNLSGRSSYADLISLADMDLQMDQPMYPNWDIRLLYLLLIEPYCIIYEKNKQKKNGGKTYELRNSYDCPRN